MRVKRLWWSHSLKVLGLIRIKNVLKILAFLASMFLAFVFYVYFSFDKNMLLRDFQSRALKSLL